MAQWSWSCGSGAAPRACCSADSRDAGCRNRPTPMPPAGSCRVGPPLPRRRPAMPVARAPPRLRVRAEVVVAATARLLVGRLQVLGVADDIGGADLVDGHHLDNQPSVTPGERT